MAPPANRCFSRDEILRFLEDVAAEGGMTRELEIVSHLDGCDECRQTRDALLREFVGLEQSLSLLWKRERISCPHRDLLSGYLHRSLPPEPSDYVRFHLEVVGCEFCQANLEDIREGEDKEEPALKKVRDDVLQSTTAFLKKRRP